MDHRLEFCHYWEKLGIISGGQINKALAFNTHGLLEQTPEGWICHHKPGYNKTDHILRWEDGSLRCSCQCNTISQKMCSHILAVHIMREFKEEERRTT